MNPRDMARALGRRGGRARARRLSPKQRRRIAALGGKARAGSLQAARRVAQNLEYAKATRDLRGPAPTVVRSCGADRLPGIYPAEG